MKWWEIDAIHNEMMRERGAVKNEMWNISGGKWSACCVASAHLGKVKRATCRQRKKTIGWMRIFFNVWEIFVFLEIFVNFLEIFVHVWEIFVKRECELCGLLSSFKSTLRNSFYSEKQDRYQYKIRMSGHYLFASDSWNRLVRWVLLPLQNNIASFIPYESYD